MKENNEASVDDDLNTSALATIEGGMSLTDFTQVAMQTGVSMLHLNDIQAKYRFIDLWKQKLASKLLERDFESYRGFQAGRAALREWRAHLQR